MRINPFASDPNASELANETEHRLSHQCLCHIPAKVAQYG
jgi:hypothetical protein